MEHGAKQGKKGGKKGKGKGTKGPGKGPHWTQQESHEEWKQGDEWQEDTREEPDSREEGGRTSGANRYVALLSSGTPHCR